MQIRDSLTLDASGLSRTKDGYLIGDAKVSRAGNVQQYYGGEIGLTGDDAGKVFGVYRDPAVVFDEKAMLSLAGRPVTRNHPPEGVTAENWKDLTVGNMGGVIKRDGEHVVATMAIMDATAAAEIEAGARALSAGYTVGLTADAGIAPDGTPYQYRQSGELRFNHVAYLPGNNPRAGNTRIGDDAAIWGATRPVPTADMKGSHMADTLQTVVLGDQAAQVAVADAPKIEAFKAASAKALSDAQADHAKAIAAKDAELAKLQAKLDDATGKVLTDAALDARVQARADLIGKAKMIAKDVATTGLSDAAIRKAAVVAALGDAAIAGKPEAYIDARFDILAEDAAKGDPVAKALADVTKGTDRASIYQKRDEDLANAWRGDNKKEAV